MSQRRVTGIMFLAGALVAFLLSARGSMSQVQLMTAVPQHGALVVDFKADPNRPVYVACSIPAGQSATIYVLRPARNRQGISVGLEQLASSTSKMSDGPGWLIWELKPTDRWENGVDIYCRVDPKTLVPENRASVFMLVSQEKPDLTDNRSRNNRFLETPHDKFPEPGTFRYFMPWDEAKVFIEIVELPEGKPYRSIRTIKDPGKQGKMVQETLWDFKDDDRRLVTGSRYEGTVSFLLPGKKEPQDYKIPIGVYIKR